MAQLPDIKKKNSLLSWGGLIAREDSSHTTLLAHNATRQAVSPVTESNTVVQAATVAATAIARPMPRPKRAGLGIGERKLLQAVSDLAMVLGGSLTILTLSARNYTEGEILLSLVAICALWFFFADAFDAYKMPVMQSVFRSGYTAAKVLLLTVLTYTLVAWFAGGLLPIIRPRISETLEAMLLVVPLLVGRTVISRLLTHAPLRRRVVVVGANRDGFEMGDALARYDGKTYELLGYFDDESRAPSSILDQPSDSSRNNPQFSIRDGITQLVWPATELLPIHDNVGIDQVVLANPNQTVKLLNTLSLLHERGVQITPMFAIYQDLTGRVPVSHLGDDWYVALPAHVK